MTEHAPAYNLYQLWEQGELTDTEAMRALCVELAAVESEIGPLEESRAQLRTQIGHIAARLGDRIDVPGFGTSRSRRRSRRAPATKRRRSRP